jgi:hypothetical protein
MTWIDFPLREPFGCFVRLNCLLTCEGYLCDFEGCHGCLLYDLKV